MNKIYKVIYSKVRQCYVVVSEIAKSHGRHTHSSVAKSSSALTAAVLIALGSFSFTGMPTAQAEDAINVTNDYIGINTTVYNENGKKENPLLSKRDSSNSNYGGVWSENPGAITVGVYAGAGQQTVTIGNNNRTHSVGSVYIGEHKDYLKPGNQPTPAYYVTSVGFNADAGGYGSIAIGSNAQATNSDTNTGLRVYQKSDENGNGYGYLENNPTLKGASVAVGYSANAADGNVAIGAYSQALMDDKAKESLKKKSVYTDEEASSYVSVGGTVTTKDTSGNSTTSPIRRRISNVAGGVEASDAATVGQLQKAIDSIGTTGWKLRTNSDDTKAATITSGTTVDFSPAVDGKNGTADHSNVTVSNAGSNVKIGLNRNIVLGEATSGNGGSLNVYSDSTEASNLGNRVSIDGSTVSVNYGSEKGTSGTKRGVVLGVGEDWNHNAQGYIAFNNIDPKGKIDSTYLHSATDAPDNLKGRLVYSNTMSGTEYIANLDDGITFTGDVNSTVPEGYTQTPTKLNTTLNITGGAATEADLTSGNIGVVSTPAAEKENEDGSTSQTQESKLEIKLNKDLKGITSITSQSTTNTTGAKIELSNNGTTISGGDVNVSGSKVTGLADGEKGTDAVTVKQLNDAKNDLSVNAGWGINIEDVTTKDENGKEMTKKNVISLKRNLGKNYGSRYGTGKVNFEADGENSLILGGGALNDSWEDRDKEVTYGAHGKDSILVGGLNNDIAKDSEKVATSIGTKASIGTRAVIIGGTSNTVSYDPVTEKDPDTGKEKVKVDSNGNVIVQTQKTGTDAIIVGGLQNTAKGDGSVLIGGESNEATGFYSTVIGGTSNKTDGWLSSIFGGTKNTITGAPTAAGIFGGTRNTINSNGIAANVFGGENNTADNTLAVVVGGETNTSSGPASIILGGNHNTANQLLATVVGGQLNTATGETSMISGGIGNVTSGAYSYDAGGLYNRVTGMAASSLGGLNSSVNGMFSTGVAGGSTGENAILSLAAGYQSVVTDSGVEKTYVTGDDAEKVLEDQYSGKELPGYYTRDQSVDYGPGEPGRLIHYDKFSTALGYQATADEPGTIAFGHDAGDESGYTYEWETLTDENGNPKQNEIDGTTNDYTKAPKSVKKKAPYTSAYYNRLVKVADGIDDHDVVVMEQLKQYAEKDASNIGNNIKVYKTDANGNVQLDKDKKPIEETDATTTAQNGSKDAWGKALGAGTFTTGTDTTPTNASISDQLVTGKTLYDYDKPTGSTNYVKVNNTTGQNLSALDAQVKANADALDKPNHNIKYYSVKTAPLTVDGYTNEKNDGAQGKGSIAAGFVTHADGIASTVTGSYSGVINSGTAQGRDLRGAAALSYGTVNVNQNTDSTKAYSGVANSIVGQANMTTNSNAAIIYGAGNTVTDSYRPIDKEKAKAILDSTSDPKALSKAMQDAVKDSGGQVMVMGGGNVVDNAYMSQVTGVGNTVKGNQVYAKNAKTGKWEWTTDTNKDTAIKGYDKDKSSQYNYVDGFNNEVINGKYDYVIGANNTVTGDSYDDKAAKRYSNESNIVFGDNHTLTNTKNAVIIGSSDTQMILDRGDNATAIGHNASAQRDALAVGVNTQARGNAVALGTYSTAHNNSIAIGTKATAVSSQNLAIGWEAHIGNIATDDEKIKNAVALGSDSQVKVNDLLESDNNRGVLSIGDKDKERRIIHVRAGVNDTDAVNVSQLKSAQNDLTDKGITFAANSGAEYTAKLGGKVKIQGTDNKKAGHEYTADNLTTEIDKDGNITILMDKDMSTETLAVNGKDGKAGQPGTPGSIGISGQDGKAGVGIDGKDGISIKGHNGKDGVTIKGIDGVDGVDGAEGHIGLNGKDGMTDIFTTAGKPGLNGKDGETMTRIVYKDPKGTEHEAATLDDGLKFKGDDDTVIAKNLNNTMEIIGGADSKNLTEGNIGVNSTDKGQLKVQLAKDLTGITSISNQKTEGDKTTGAKIDLGTDGSVNVNGGKITNVGSGADASGQYTETTNAANIGDVQKIAETTATGLTGKGLKFAANSGAEYTAKLGSTVKIQGTDKKDGHEYTADNLTTEIDKDGNITILMDKDMSTEKLAVNGKDGKEGQPGTAGSIGIKGQDGKAGVGIDGKDGISIKGRDGKDGVTMKAVDGTDGTEGHIGLTGPKGTNGKDGTNAIDITVKNGYDDAAKGINGTNGVDGKDGITRIVYTDKTGEHQVATLEDGLKFKGDDDTVIAKKLNNTLDIIGGAKGDLTEGNIGVNSTTDGKLNVQLAKDLKGITSISNQKTTKVDGKDVATGAKIDLDEDGSVNVNGGKITNVGSGADASGKYTETTNVANIGDVQNIVNDAKTELTNGANGLNKKANIDASNIGANLKGADGKTAATEAEKTKNENAWGSAIGTGKIEKDNGQLVTGKTVYDEVRPTADGSYIKKDKTTGENLSALDTQVKTNADNIAKNTESIQNITNNMKNLGDNAVQYDKDSNKSKVTLGGKDGTVITNVKDGALSENSKDAVNGKQLYNEQQAREAADKAITEKVTNNTNEITKIKNGDFTDASKTAIHNIAKDAVAVVNGKNTTVTKVEGTDTTPTTYAVNVEGTGKVAAGDTGLISGDTLYKEVHIDKDGAYIKGSQSVGQNLSNLDTGLKTTSDLIHTNAKGDTIQIGGNSTATKVDISGKDSNGNTTGRVITGVVSDVSDPNSAANVGYVNGITSASNEQIYHDMNMQYNHVENDISRAAAGSNALAALHPMQEFDPDDKAQFALGYGHYRNSNAGAVGAFYQPDENSMVNFGVSFGNGDAGINAGVTFKFGPGGSGHHVLTKTQMAKVIDAQSKEIDELKKDNADKDKRIDALEQKMTEILAKLDKSKD